MPPQPSKHVFLVAPLIILGALFLASTFALLRTGRSPPQASERPPSSVELVDDALRGLDWGNIAFTTPSRLRYQQPQELELLLSTSRSVTELQKKLQQKLGADTARVRISNRMDAQLTGRGFAIVAQTPELLAITSVQTSRWQWEVTPIEHGRQRLHLTLSAHIDVAGHETPLVVRTFDRTIEVQITVAQRVSAFIGKNWQWLWAAVLVPIAAYLWRRWKKLPSRAKRAR
jgi:hypothetical protein